MSEFHAAFLVFDRYTEKRFQYYFCQFYIHLSTNFLEFVAWGKSLVKIIIVK